MSDRLDIKEIPINGRYKPCGAENCDFQRCLDEIIILRKVINHMKQFLTDEQRIECATQEILNRGHW